MTPRPSLSERIYAALLRLYPEEIRRDYGPDMRDVFRDHLRDARRRTGARGVLALWLRTIPDVLFTGVHEHETDMLQTMVQDARYAARIMRKNPVFTLVAIVVVALGVGAVSTIFSVANAVILRPIPGVAHQSNVVAIERTRSDGATSRSASYPYYEYLAARTKTMRAVAAWDMVPVAISTGVGGVPGNANLVTPSYFRALGVRPALGRFFTADEGRAGEPRMVAVISDELWRRLFASDSGVVGRRVQIDGRQFTIVGVAPPRFTGLFPVLRVDAWMPMPVQPLVRRGGDLLRAANSGWLDVVGSVAPGVTRAQARAELAGLTTQYATSIETKATHDTASFTDVQLTTVAGLPAGATQSVLAFFGVLIAISGLVLVIASVDVASMLLARAVARRREIAVRIALGAARARLVRQLLTESVLLFAAGGALGALFAEGATRLLSRVPLPTDVPLSVDPSPDARVLVVTIVVALATGIVFGLAPALQGSRGGVAAALRGDSAGSGRSRSRLRGALVAGQIAASLVLLTASGLFVRALARGQHVDPGYRIDHVATTALDVSLSGYDSVRARTFYATLAEQVSRIPGVERAAYTRIVPLSLNNSGYGITIPGRTVPGSFANADAVSAGYFDVMRQPILAGRAILATDNASSPLVAVVSEAFAKKFYPGEQALGRTFMLDSSTTITIVGITRDVKFAKLDERTGPFMYLPIDQHWRPDVNLLVRTSGDATTVLAAIRSIVRALDTTLPPPLVITMERASAAALLPQRFAVIITASLGAAGLLLAAIGLYGVLSFATAQRRHEIGVRMALGAAAGDVLRLIVREGMNVVGVGVAVGLALAALGTRAMAPFLFGVNPLDLPTLAVTTLILVGTALVACLLPARRAAKSDPLIALRAD